MTHVPHDLSEEFPGHADAIHRLKTENAHFAKLSNEYHDVNRQIHRIETDVEPASDERATEYRKARMRLKDEIAAMLNGAET